MWQRVLPLLAIFFTAALSIALAEGIHQVTIVKAGEGKLTCVDQNGNEHTITVAQSAKITLDDKNCKLDDLRKDMKAGVTGERINDEKTITSIAARSN